MDNSEPCSICGCTQMNLVDGFYYCAECGTQDTNIRETLVEFITVEEGVTAKGTRRRITQIPQAKQEDMTDDWYRWHSLNFLLRGLADELIENGASPSFKTKLLWIWTKYMKKYQKKADFGLDANDSDNNEANEQEELTIEDDNFISDDDDDDNEIPDLNRRKYDFSKITRISIPLVQAFLYVALNLDKSEIQLTHLIRLMKEGRLSILTWQKLIPKELRPKRLHTCLFFNRTCFKYSYEHIRMLALELFRNLNLGDPIVPDLRHLLDLYMKELCLPNDLKPLVISLMHYHSFNYLDINVRNKNFRIPSYENYVMSHILMALKICFGLDSEYENKISDAVDKINKKENYPKSYNSEPTQRLFSFREWCNYLQFRKALLNAHTLYLGAPNYFDMNDYVAFEHQIDFPDDNIDLNDEIAMNIIKKIVPRDINVIPKGEFVSTMTPYHSYTRVIVDHLQDPDVKKLLEEDFTQYSVRYILKDMFLVDLDSPKPKNIIAGVRRKNLKESSSKFDFLDPVLNFSKGMVYVKDCDNHNWMITQPPNLEHIIETKSNGDEKENDHGYESNSETSQNVHNSKFKGLDVTKNTESKHKSAIHFENDSKFDHSSKKMEVDEVIQSDSKDIINSSSMIIDTEKMETNENSLKIREEVEGVNIFDDDFLFFDTKKEEKPEDDAFEEPHEEPSVANGSFFLPDKMEYDGQTQNYRTSRASETSSEDSIRLNPESLDRNKAIEELVIHACNKLKVSIPGKYIHITRKRTEFKKKTYNKINRCNFKGETTLKIKALVAAYHENLQNDVLLKMSNMVKSAIVDFNKTKDEPEPPEPMEESVIEQNEVDNAIEENIEEAPNNTEAANNTTQGIDLNDVTINDDEEYKLYGDSSDGETHAEELLPKKNPKFDENTHDITQLFIKPTGKYEVPEVEINPNLYRIIDKKIEETINNSSATVPEKDKDKSDSDEDLPLSLLKEQLSEQRQLARQRKLSMHHGLNAIIKCTIPPYNYWVRHYIPDVKVVPNINQRFFNELNANLPKSFAFVLKECANVLGHQPSNLYKGLTRVEECLIEKYVNRKRFNRVHFSKVNQRQKYKQGF